MSADGPILDIRHDCVKSSSPTVVHQQRPFGSGPLSAVVMQCEHAGRIVDEHIIEEPHTAQVEVSSLSHKMLLSIAHPGFSILLYQQIRRYRCPIHPNRRKRPASPFIFPHLISLHEDCQDYTTHIIVQKESDTHGLWCQWTLLIISQDRYPPVLFRIIHKSCSISY